MSIQTHQITTQDVLDLTGKQLYEDKNKVLATMTNTNNHLVILALAPGFGKTFLYACYAITIWKKFKKKTVISTHKKLCRDLVNVINKIAPEISKDVFILMSETKKDFDVSKCGIILTHHIYCKHKPYSTDLYAPIKELLDNTKSDDIVFLFDEGSQYFSSCRYEVATGGFYQDGAGETCNLISKWKTNSVFRGKCFSILNDYGNIRIERAIHLNKSMNNNLRFTFDFDTLPTDNIASPYMFSRTRINPKSEEVFKKNYETDAPSDDTEKVNFFMNNLDYILSNLQLITPMMTVDGVLVTYQTFLGDDLKDSKEIIAPSHDMTPKYLGYDLRFFKLLQSKGIQTIFLSGEFTDEVQMLIDIVGKEKSVVDIDPKPSTFAGDINCVVTSRIYKSFNDDVQEFSDTFKDGIKGIWFDARKVTAKEHHSKTPTFIKNDEKTDISVISPFEKTLTNDLGVTYLLGGLSRGTNAFKEYNFVAVDTTPYRPPYLYNGWSVDEVKNNICKGVVEDATQAIFRIVRQDSQVAIKKTILLMGVGDDQILFKALESHLKKLLPQCKSLVFTPVKIDSHNSKMTPKVFLKLLAKVIQGDTIGILKQTPKQKNGLNIFQKIELCISDGLNSSIIKRKLHYSRLPIEDKNLFDQYLINRGVI